MRRAARRDVMTESHYRHWKRSISGPDQTLTRDDCRITPVFEDRGLRADFDEFARIMHHLAGGQFAKPQ